MRRLLRKPLAKCSRFYVYARELITRAVASVRLLLPAAFFAEYRVGINWRAAVFAEDRGFLLGDALFHRARNGLNGGGSNACPRSAAKSHAARLL